MTSLRKRHPVVRTGLFWGLLIATAATCRAVINVGLQPYDLFTSRYTHVFELRIREVDATAGTMACHVAQSFKGTFEAGKELTLSFVDGMTPLVEKGVADGEFTVGNPMVVFAGRRRKPNDIMLYAGAFYLGSIVDADHWTVDRGTESMVGVDGQTIDTLAGTWNGATEQLVRMAADMAADRDHFPRKAYARFQEDVLLARFDGPVHGVAIYDIEGDGDQDIVACSPAGDRIYLQTDGMKFIDATTTLKLDSRSRSCSLADVNADGLTDLLVGATLYLGSFAFNQFGFVRTDLLAPELAENLKLATFAELNGDGWPDILTSQAGRGLRAFLNRAQEATAFEEATERMGLNRPACGAGGDGYVAVGDWNNDLAADLFYAVGGGYLLVQDPQGVFEPVEQKIAFDFGVGAEDLPGRTGAGVFLPMFEPARMDLVVPIEDGWLTVANREGTPVDVTAWGNEISEGSNHHLATIADDFNLDGHIDFYTVSAAENGHNRFIVNRGYGSFMLGSVHKNYEHMFKGPAEQLGGLGVASGDVNGDAMPDLVIGNMHGHLTLTLNDTLPARADEVHPPREIAQLQKVRLLTARVLGRTGVTNARVRVFDRSNRLVARRDLGMNIASGCSGPNMVTLALREPAEYTLRVQYGDGLERELPVDLREQSQVLVDVDRGEKGSADVW